MKKVFVGVIESLILAFITMITLASQGYCIGYDEPTGYSYTTAILLYNDSTSDSGFLYDDQDHSGPAQLTYTEGNEGAHVNLISDYYESHGIMTSGDVNRTGSWTGYHWWTLTEFADEIYFEITDPQLDQDDVKIDFQFDFDVVMAGNENLEEDQFVGMIIQLNYLNDESDYGFDILDEYIIDQTSDLQMTLSSTGQGDYGLVRDKTYVPFLFRVWGLINRTPDASIDWLNSFVFDSINVYQGDIQLDPDQYMFTTNKMPVPAVPEPSTVLLFGFGLLTLVGVIRKKHNF